MKRFLSIVLSIVLGAGAVGIGMGIFLWKANEDRERLSEMVSQAQQDIERAREARERAVRDANEKLDTANTEIQKAQYLVTTLQEEREQITQASVLIPSTSSKTYKGWNEIINLPLGITAKYPPQSIIDINDQTMLAFGYATTSQVSTSTASLEPNRWFIVSGYQLSHEQELLGRFTTSTALTYLVDRHLLVGRIGTIASSTEPIVVLRSQRAGQSNLLFWIRVPASSTKDPLKTLTDLLATLSFKK